MFTLEPLEKTVNPLIPLPAEIEYRPLARGIIHLMNYCIDLGVEPLYAANRLLNQLGRGNSLRVLPPLFYGITSH